MKYVKRFSLLNEAVVDPIQVQYKKLLDMRKSNVKTRNTLQAEFDAEVKIYGDLITNALSNEMEVLKSVLSKVYPKAKITPIPYGFSVAFSGTKEVQQSKDNPGYYYVKDEKAAFAAQEPWEIKTKIEKAAKKSKWIMVTETGTAERGSDKPGDYWDYWTIMDIEVKFQQQFQKSLLKSKTAPNSGL